MDRYTKTVLTVIAGCLLVLVGNQIDFHSKAYAEAGAASADLRSVGVTEQGWVYFAEFGTDTSIWACASGECKKALFED